MTQHLTLQERELPHRLSRAGTSKTEIATLMNRNRSTIYREIGRNSGDRGCRPKQAQRLADARRQRARRGWKLDDPQVQQYVTQRLTKA